MGKKSGADPDVASGVRLIGKLRGIIYYMLLMVKQSVGRGHPTAPGQRGSKKLGLWRRGTHQKGRQYVVETIHKYF